ncbi:hypothetical protein BN159_p30 (plasmid) [Streptomyces davaonensis JCM 4913]|uniref:Uncharacterized protein n=1 Tax=Streptomyces davaonensis (strain DSM 101723 / JCM 4913 / KCC S-0913 / 768) TaxID=1214101 RepID=K4RGM9_STRDJ|nr:hypothetical protein BN159_p30 [Streptomyces davaonensis JCM 4913]
MARRSGPMAGASKPGFRPRADDRGGRSDQNPVLKCLSANRR